MLFPEFLYSAFQRAAGRPPYTRMLYGSLSTTAASGSLGVTIPDDTDGIIENIFFKASVPGGETIDRVAYHLAPPVDSAAVSNMIDEDFAIANAEYNKNFESTPLYLPRGYRIIVVVRVFYGLKVSGGAEDVGRATTRSVVMSIFLIIVADCAFNFV
jgi:hypothetical protein